MECFYLNHIFKRGFMEDLLANGCKRESCGCVIKIF